jgi:hypothetical protein
MRARPILCKTLFAAAVAGALGFGVSSANATVDRRAIITDTAQECQQYCSTRGGHYAWDSRTGACHCW